MEVISVVAEYLVICSQVEHEEVGEQDVADQASKGNADLVS